MKKLLEMLTSLEGNAERIIVLESPSGANVVIEQQNKTITLDIECKSETHFTNVTRVVDFYLEKEIA